MTSKIQNSFVDRRASLIDALSRNNSEEHSDMPLVEDVWKRIILFLDTRGLENLSLISRSICIIVLESTSYVWHVQNKPKLCTVISKSILLLDKINEDMFKIMASFIEILLKSGATDIAKKTVRRCRYEYDRSQQLTNTIAQYQIQQGDIEEAKNTLIEARDWALQVSSNRDAALLDVIKMQVKCGDIEHAEETARNMTQKEIQAEAHTYIAQNEAQHDYVSTIEDRVLEFDTNATNERNDGIEEIENIAEDSALDDYHKAKSLISIAGLQLQMGALSIAKTTLSDARKVILSIPEDYDRDGKDKALAILFKYCLQIDDGEGAVESFSSIWVINKKVNILLQVMHRVENQIESNTLITLTSSIEGIRKVLLESNQEWKMYFVP